jgi:hypothetical protein
MYFNIIKLKNNYFLFLNIMKKTETKKAMTIDDLIRMGKITSKTIDRVNIVKSYIEKKYNLRKQRNEEKKKGKK